MDALGPVVLKLCGGWEVGVATEGGAPLVFQSGPWSKRGAQKERERSLGWKDKEKLRGQKKLR